MKKTFLTCMAVLALFAIAGSASAITCTIDQRPAATLLVPYFAVSLTDPRHRADRQTAARPDSFDTLRHDRQRLFGADDRARQRVQQAVRRSSSTSTSP